MKNDTGHRLVTFYVLGVGLVYVLTLGLWGNVAGLRVLHQDLPAWVSDNAFQVKALVNLSAGVVLLLGGMGLVSRRAWGTAVTVIGLVWQMTIYAVELGLFRYGPTLGTTAVVVPLNTAIIDYLTRRIRADQTARDRDSL